MNPRELPSIDQLLIQAPIQSLQVKYGRTYVLHALRGVLQQYRDQSEARSKPPSLEEIAREAESRLAERSRSTLAPVINATGVILNTNLGRALLSQAAMEAIRGAAVEYVALEYDLPSGERGSRHAHAEGLLKYLSGAESSAVVNNNAAAVLLAVASLGRGKEVLIARSQLVEIGGGFRIPDVIRLSGAKLVEVGTTNRTRVADYENAFTPKTGAVLVVHPSNFRIVGFTEEPTLHDLVIWAEQKGLPVLHDLGSGALLATEKYGLPHEMTIQESVKAGASLTMFSGDKLLGGPQAGILVGQGIWIEKIRKHPLMRAVRPDKLCLAALEATLLHYAREEAEREIPVWRMIAVPTAEIQNRAKYWKERLGFGNVLEAKSTIGGGSLPGETLPTHAFCISHANPQIAMKCLRIGSPPVIARVEQDTIFFDPRTVLPEQDERLMAAIQALEN